MTRTLLCLILALAILAPHLLAAAPPKRTVIRSVPAGNIYAYENAAGETAEEMENREGKLISRRFYRPALSAFQYIGKGQVPWFDCSMTMAMNQRRADGPLASVPPTSGHAGC